MQGLAHVHRHTQKDTKTYTDTDTNSVEGQGCVIPHLCSGLK